MVQDVPTMLEGIEIPVSNIVDTDSLTLKDRCDMCAAAALVRASKSTAAADLLFCGSHAKKNVSALIEQNWQIDDQTYRIFPGFKGEHIKRNPPLVNTISDNPKVAQSE